MYGSFTTSARTVSEAHDLAAGESRKSPGDWKSAGGQRQENTMCCHWTIEYHMEVAAWSEGQIHILSRDGHYL